MSNSPGNSSVENQALPLIVDLEEVLSYSGLLFGKKVTGVEDLGIYEWAHLIHQRIADFPSASESESMDVRHLRAKVHGLLRKAETDSAAWASVALARETTASERLEAHEREQLTHARRMRDPMLRQARKDAARRFLAEVTSAGQVALLQEEQERLNTQGATGKHRHVGLSLDDFERALDALRVVSLRMQRFHKQPIGKYRCPLTPYPQLEDALAPRFDSVERLDKEIERLDEEAMWLAHDQVARGLIEAELEERRILGDTHPSVGPRPKLEALSEATQVIRRRIEKEQGVPGLRVGRESAVEAIYDGHRNSLARIARFLPSVGAGPIGRTEARDRGILPGEEYFIRAQPPIPDLQKRVIELAKAIEGARDRWEKSEPGDREGRARVPKWASKPAKIAGGLKLRDILRTDEPPHIRDKARLDCQILDTDVAIEDEVSASRATIDRWLREDIREGREHPFTLNKRRLKQACTCRLKVWGAIHKLGR